MESMNAKKNKADQSVAKHYLQSQPLLFHGIPPSAPEQKRVQGSAHVSPLSTLQFTM